MYTSERKKNIRDKNSNGQSRLKQHWASPDIGKEQTLITSAEISRSKCYHRKESHGLTLKITWMQSSQCFDDKNPWRVYRDSGKSVAWLAIQSNYTVMGVGLAGFTALEAVSLRA